MPWKTLVPCLGVTLALTSASCSSSTTASSTPTPSNAVSTSSAAPTTQPQSTSTSSSAPDAAFALPLESSQALLDQLVTSTGAPGALMAVSVHGGPPTILTSGVSNATTKVPMKPSDVMPIASVSKTFVGALLLLLVRDGKVALDAPISTYGIDFPHATVITVRELLSHTSGLPPLGGDTGRPDPYSLAWQNKLLGDLHHHFTLDEVLAYVRDRPLLFAPGTSTAYSNINTDLAAKVVEQVTGTSWTAALRDRLLTPLGLSTVFDPGNEVPTVAAMQGLFVLEGNPTVLDTGNFDHASTVSGLGPAGAIVAGAADLITWGNALLRDDTLLGPDLTQQAHAIGAGGTGLGVLGYSANGYCVFVGCPSGATFTGVGGAGSLPGARTVLLYDKETDSVLLVFANRTPASIENIVAPELRLIRDAETAAP
jgi:D-alanyl-D-alanine carboxypeptidase